MMKLKIVAIAAITSVLFACGGNDQKGKIEGIWKLTGFSNNGEKVELSECDKQTTWDFTSDKAEPLGDGTEVQHLKGTAPEDCKFYSFDSKWTVTNGKLFVSTSRIGGLGGSSLAGMMEIVELTDNKLVLRIMKKEITLEK